MKLDLIDVMGQLFPDPLTVVPQLCATAILFFVLLKLVWKPAKKIMDARSEYEQKKINDALQLEDENKQLNAQAHQFIDEAKKQAQLTIQQAQEEGSRIKNNLIEQGKQQSQQIVDEAVANINLQKDKMLQDMHRQMVDVALSATEKMLQTKINTQTDIDSIDSFVKEVSQQ